MRSVFDHDGDEVKNLFVLILDSDTPPISTLYLLFCIEHLLCAGRFTYITSCLESLLCADVAGLVALQVQATGLVAFPGLGAILEAPTAARARDVAVPAKPVHQEGGLGT